MKLLSRTEFRESVFARDGGRCVFCGDGAQDAHHIMERRLWTDGGYYLDNGASVCGPCHIACERTDHSTAAVRAAAGIERVALPPHLEPETIYDKWGNPELPNGQRLKGELFEEESVQKILADKLHLFTSRVKYPRTPYLPWSPEEARDIRVDPDKWIGQRVIVTEKMDGENATLYSDYYHARSIDGRNHPSRNWVKALQARIGADIPEGWRICGENLWSVHSIEYSDLSSYFYAFSCWDERQRCLSWDEACEWFALLGLDSVPVWYDGAWSPGLEKELNERVAVQGCEGYVIRLAEEFPASQFQSSVGKFVRAGHVQTDSHWMYKKIQKNRLKDLTA